MAEVYLKNIKIKWNKTILILGLSIIGLSIVISGILTYYWSRCLLGVVIGSVIGAIIGVIGNFLILTSSKLIKELVGESSERVNIKDDMLVVLKDKDGKIIER
jgi:uncharacterized membrane-anchored protein